MKKTVLVIFGGRSSEYAVSLVSASSVAAHIPAEKYDVITLGITEDGRWLLYEGPVTDIPDDGWLKGPCCPAMLCPDYGSGTLKVFRGPAVEDKRVDVVFPVLHGKNGEDGTIQGLLELCGLPFVGSAHLASGMCMDKDVTNTMLRAADIPHADWLAVLRHDYLASPEGFAARCSVELGFPVFVKPANAGSSVGISKVNSVDGLDAAVRSAFEIDGKVVVEQAVDVLHETECSVMGNAELMISEPGEISSCNEFYDYDAKYVEDSSLSIPADIPSMLKEKIREISLRAYRALGCRGFARVDSFVTRSGEVLINEINTIPGFTSISMFPKLMEHYGLSYGELVDRLLTLAEES